MSDQSCDMMDEFDYWALRLLKILVAGLLLILFLLAVAWWIEPPPARRAPAQFTQAEKRWIEKRHKYHGIYGSVIENGEHYFYRDGKRCKL